MQVCSWVYRKTWGQKIRRIARNGSQLIYTLVSDQALCRSECSLCERHTDAQRYTSCLNMLLKFSFLSGKLVLYGRVWRLLWIVRGLFRIKKGPLGLSKYKLPVQADRWSSFDMCQAWRLAYPALSLSACSTEWQKLVLNRACQTVSLSCRSRSCHAIRGWTDLVSIMELYTEATEADTSNDESRAVET